MSKNKIDWEAKAKLAMQALKKAKTAKPAKTPKAPKLSTECPEAPKKRGRPRKNPIVEKVETPTECATPAPEVKRSRGRPRKVIFEKGVREVSTKTFRHFGFCPSCVLSICSPDIRHTKFSCPRCGKEGKVTELKAEMGLDRPATKKEYLSTVNSQFIDYYGAGKSNLAGCKKNSDAFDKVEDTVETPPMKTDEEDIIGEHGEDTKED